MPQLYLVRHGQASYGHENYDKLSPLGVKQSTLLGDYFRQRDIHFDSMITGDMVRHKETAMAIQEGMHTSLPLHADSGWNEFDFVSVISAYLQMYPEQKPADDAPRVEFYRLLKAAMQAWSKGQIDTPLPESWQEFSGRVKQAMNKIHTMPSGNVLVASSGGAIALSMMHIFSLDVEQTIGLNLQIRNASVSHFFVNKHSMQLSQFNSVTHLDDASSSELITYS